MSTSRREDGYLPISAYALLGNCHSAALVGIDGSIDWYCPLRFDAPALLCRVLDAEKGGSLAVAPAEHFRAERRYRPGTAILETTFTAGSFRMRVTDFMPLSPRKPSEHGQDVETPNEIVRLIEGLEGEGEVEIRFAPTPEFGTAEAEISIDGNGVTVNGGDAKAVLHVSGATLSCEENAVCGRLHLKAGDRQWLVLSGAGHDRHEGELERCDALLSETQAYWERWSASCTYRGPYRDEVVRSAITLKLLTYEPTGAIVAAPTTSLPEAIGGPRNWDYRYTWMRDSALILYALMSVGYRGEAIDFLRWLHRTCTPDEAPQIMYTIDGGHEMPERVIDTLSGYRGSRPVRTGNGAATQTQLDIYGEALLAADILFGKHHDPDDRGHGAEEQDRALLHEMWPLLTSFANRAAENWDCEGEGIWEVRGGPRHFLFGKLMCWAALDRALHLARTHTLDAPTERWEHVRDEIRAAILQRGFNTEMGTFTQSFDSDVLDATALFVSRIGFLPATDERVRSTTECIRQHLTKNGLVYRYLAKDGLAGGEGTFVLCTFWLVDALATEGRVDDARDLFDRVLRIANDVGLLSEEVAPESGELLGNFPQGFSHLALIQSVVNLAKAAEHGPEKHPESMGQRAARAGKAASKDHDLRK